MSRDHSRCGTSLLLFFRPKCEHTLLLASIDNILERPFLTFYNPLSDDVPDADIDFALYGSHHFEVDDILLDPKHHPRQIDDELLVRMKRPIDLPDEDYQPDYASGDPSGLVDTTSAISRASRHHLSSSRGKHHECAPAPDVRYGSAHCTTAYFVEPPDTPRRTRSFGHARH